MNFAQKTKPSTTIKVNQALIPLVTISEKALNQMFIYTKEVSDEVGWLGTAFKHTDNSYHIEETFLFDQEVHATTTEITPEGLNKFAEELLSKPNGHEVWNDIKMWGHSHVNMGVTPSGQDDKQMEEFSSVGHDFFIRLICNKKGELRIDVYDYEAGLTFLNVEWKAVNQPNPEEEVVMEQIKKLMEQVEQMREVVQKSRDERTKAIEEPIKEEIKAKVRKFTHKTKNVTTYGGPGYAGYEGYGGQWATEVDLDDYLVEQEINYLINNVSTKPQFVNQLNNIGVGYMLSQTQISSLYSQLIQRKFFAGGKTQ